MESRSPFGKQFSDNGKQATQELVWDDTRAFLALVRHGTLSAAAVSLDMGIATLSRRIDRLEASLKVPLFVRKQTGYLLTEEGVELVEKAQAMEAAALAFACGADTNTAISGKVRLATADNLATSLILPALPDFLQQHPQLSVELVTDIATASLHRHEADLAIRMVKPERGNVSFRRLGVLGYGLYGKMDQAGIESHGLITWTQMQSHLPAAQWIARTLHGREPRLATTSLSTQVAAAKAGIGLAVLPHIVAADAGLTCIDPDIGVSQPIYLAIQSDLARSPRVRALADFLCELVIQNRSRLSGL